MILLKIKKPLLFLMALALVVPLVFAAGSGSSAPGASAGSAQGSDGGVQQATEQETQNQGEDSALQVANQNNMQAGAGTQVQERTQYRQVAQSAAELGQMIRTRQAEMQQEMQGMGEGRQEMYRNQNQVRLAVHSMLAMEGLAGGMGSQISQIARQFNNSVQATIRAEERIQTRSSFSRFLFGGDNNAAGELEQETIRNRERLQELNQVMNQCDCTAEVRAMMQEQMRNMEQEQTRLEQLAQQEKKSKGFLGWLWK